MDRPLNLRDVYANIEGYGYINLLNVLYIEKIPNISQYKLVFSRDNFITISERQFLLHVKSRISYSNYIDANIPPADKNEDKNLTGFASESKEF